jgi:O-acetyl-ADP-ribose deacetylase (regulator of RNase III)
MENLLMQKIEYRKGDLLTTDIKHIAHGCNAQGVMGSGVAKAIRDKYPQAYRDYNDVYNSRGLNLGDAVYSHQDDGKIIVNAITQQNYGRDPNIVYVSYWAIAESFRKIEMFNIKEIALPMIGAGLANGDWNVISAIIENTLTKTKPVVYQL